MNPSNDPIFFLDSPARDARFTVVDTWQECARFPDGDPRKIPEFMHRQMNEEMDATECSARTLTDFPDAPWELRMFLARQCADEARHALVFSKLFQQRGGKLGQYPVMNFQYRIICKIDNLVGRLAVQNRTFEAGGIDAIEFGIDDARNQGDDELAAFFDIQFADEIMHVRCANEFLHEMIAREPRLALKVGDALREGLRAFAKVFGREGMEVTKYTISEQGRLEAGFRPDEVEISNRQAEQRRDRAAAKSSA
jgi:uncharacterized ferritin-like protein (DUF455 family)